MGKETHPTEFKALSYDPSQAPTKCSARIAVARDFFKFGANHQRARLSILPELPRAQATNGSLVYERRPFEGTGNDVRAPTRNYF